MATLNELNRAIQRAVGAEDDGRWGMRSALATINALSKLGIIAPAEDHDIDPRSAATIATLDPKAQEHFTQFLLLAKGTAASLGCDYVAIKGNRTWKEQDALYAQGRTAPGKIVTNAKGGQSNHNFGIAADFGVFRGKIYVDEADADFADKVHKACSMHAAACGLDWGGSWHSIKDTPHYEVHTALSLEQKREIYSQKGSVLS